VVLDCAETDPERDGRRSGEASVVPFRRPLFLRLRPGEEVAHEIAIPVHSKRLETTAAGQLAPVETDLSTTRRVVLRVALAERRFRVGARATPEHARRLLYSWGTVVEETADVSIEPPR
jgi:hypothetical protein